MQESQSTGATHGRLLNDREAAQTLGVGERVFSDMVAAADWLPQPIILGPRLRRWDCGELLEAVRTRAPRGAGRAPEPAQLVRARNRRSKAAGG
jgi:predicted DNA-binding transcriptional regulator AlpA